MSKIEVDTIDTQSTSTALQIGDTNTATIGLGKSGDTITIPSGATITNAGTASGFGATGETSWDTTVKTTGTFTATAGVGYFLNTTGGVITVNLPVGAAGSSVALADYAGTWQTSNVTVAANGTEKIGGVDADVTLSTEGQSVTFVYIDGTQGWVNVLDSTSNVRGNEFIVATGGTITCSGDYKIHKFTGPGTFAVSAAAACGANNVVSYMVVAGGGGATDGGGGGGGFREYKNSCDPYTASPLNGNPGGTAITVTATSYPITVGGGGSGNCAPRTRGVPSTFSTITSTGGGLGVSTAGPAISPLGPGGSGGGANPSGISTGNTPPVSPAQGFPGGDAVGGGYGAAGGGGATAIGNNADPGPRVGGAGATTSISASPTAYSGGGGGGASAPFFPSPAPGGVGGGGLGSATSTPGATPGPSGPNGTVNTGGGGGGAWNGTNGNGGSGIVIIRYKFQ